MKRNPVVLIVTSNFGDGHLKVAEAIKQSLTAKGFSNIHIMDLFGEVFPRLNKLSRKFFLTRRQPAQELYGLLYELTSQMQPGDALGRLLHSMGKRKVQKVLNELQPDLIIHTFPYLAAAQLAEETAGTIPLFTVMTDYVLHGRWLHPTTEKYFIASEQLKKAMLTAGVPGDRIVVSGIPVRQTFGMPGDREMLLNKYNLDGSRRYLLLAAGAYGGLSNISGLIRQVLASTDYDIIAVCGNQQKLQSAVNEAFCGSGRVQVLGYTEYMHELMSISFCLLTKAGGITLTEALTMSLPAIVYRPLPGQEAGNAEILAAGNLLDVAYHEDQLVAQLGRLEEPTYREERLRAMKSFTKPCSAEVIADEVAQVLEKRQANSLQGWLSTAGGQQTPEVHGLLE